MILFILASIWAVSAAYLSSEMLTDLKLTEKIVDAYGDRYMLYLFLLAPFILGKRIVKKITKLTNKIQ